jgi:hypothetical protein
MKKYRIVSVAFFLSVFVGFAAAQTVSPVDFMRNNPRAAHANPAFFTPEFGFFDLGLGGVNIGVQNQGLKYDRFFRFNEVGQPVVLDLDKGIQSLMKTNYLNTGVDFDVFYCGRQTRHGFFTYSHRFREIESFSYNKDALVLLLKGNADFLGESNPAVVDLAVAARAWQEFNVGYQMCLTDQLNVGARVKFLMGYADAKTKNVTASLITDPESYALTLAGDVDARATVPYEIDYVDGDFKIKDARFNPANLFKNYGLGIDLGAEYQINDEFGVAAAINDFGFIRWNNFSVRATGEVKDGGSLYHDGSVVFGGLTPEQIDGMIDDPDYLSAFVDSLAQYYNIDFQNLAGYTTGLNTSVMVRGYYDLTPTHRFAAQLMGRYNGIGFNPALTLAYAGAFGENFDVVTTYTMMKGGYDNIGLGLSANLGGLLLYVATNNVFGFLNPANASNLNIHFGISFTGGDKSERSDRVVLP